MRVARSEALILAVARGLFDGASSDVLGPLFAAAHPMPARIGPTAAGILERTLALGAVRVLARSGGWRRERRPDAHGVLREGRLWERHQPQSLRFTGASARLLVWLAGSAVGVSAPPRRVTSSGAGDQLLALLASDALVEAGHGASLGPLAEQPLVRLAHAWWCDGDAVDWRSWLPEHAWLVEGLGDRLASAWVNTERQKAATRDPLRVLAGSRRQAVVLAGWLDACDAIGRRDLADFLWTAGERLLPDPSVPVGLGARSLDPTRPLRDRLEARVASTSLLDAWIRMDEAVHADRVTRFFDDGYELAQARLKRWERFGEQRVGVARAQRARLHDATAPG